LLLLVHPTFNLYLQMTNLKHLINWFIPIQQITPDPETSVSNKKSNSIKIYALVKFMYLFRRKLKSTIAKERKCCKKFITLIVSTSDTQMCIKSFASILCVWIDLSESDFIFFPISEYLLYFYILFHFIKFILIEIRRIIERWKLNWAEIKNK
jgi:hypothetical protein